ncbi:MAG: phosphate butyryltransferase [Marinilabiliales bacterium]|nr:MAG: phosphate butyryltransferase [Marinilabiliales bacterium]
MSIASPEQILNLARSGSRQHLVAAWAIDEHSLSAISQALSMGVVDATVVGDKRTIEKVCHENGIEANDLSIIDNPDETSSMNEAVDLINRQQGSFLMKGNLSTDKYMRAILNKEKGLMNPGAVLSHVTVLKMVNYHKLLVIGDVAIIPLPDLKQKVAIANYLIRTAHALGTDNPKLAVLAATEQVLPGMQACTDAALLSKMAERGQIRGAVVDGPLSMDLAISSEAARIKGVESEVAGDADCILFPNIESGNVFYKLNALAGSAGQAAMLVGARVPAVLSSRGDSTKTKLYSIALAATLAK